MKIGMQEILSGIEHTAIQKIKKDLEQEGFTVVLENKFFDLYAEKGDDKRIYELKIGKNKIQKRQFISLQNEAKQIGAKLYIVYLEIPRSKDIEFEGIEQLIYEDISNELPSDIDSLSTHTFIESVNDIEIVSITISDNIANLEGSGTLSTILQFGSRSDLKNGDAIVENNSLDFFFRVSVDIGKNAIIKKYYKIDTEI